MDNPLNVATPFTADTVLVPLSVPGPPLLGVPVAIATVMDAELVVTVFPPASCTVTTGCVVHAVPPVPPPGWVVNANCAAAPTVMLKALLVADVSPELVAVSS
jgi:hypothetical protein